MKKLIDKYNVLACPRSGIPKLNSKGNFIIEDVKPKRK
jgi:hypothetical protein